MTSGLPYSEREKAFIREHAFRDRTWGALARDLENLFPEDNNGFRSARAIQVWAMKDRRGTKNGRTDGFPILLDLEVLRLAKVLDFTRAELNEILKLRLLEITDLSVAAVTDYV